MRKLELMISRDLSESQHFVIEIAFIFDTLFDAVNRRICLLIKYFPMVSFQQVFSNIIYM